MHAFIFQVFNAKDNLKSTRATHSILDHNENFTELKSGDKSLSWVFLRKCFPTNFTLKEIAGMNSA